MTDERRYEYLDGKLKTRVFLNEFGEVEQVNRLGVKRARRDILSRYAAHLASLLDQQREELERYENHDEILEDEIASLREELERLRERVGDVLAHMDIALGDTDPDRIDRDETPFHWAFREITAALAPTDRKEDAPRCSVVLPVGQQCALKAGHKGAHEKKARRSGDYSAPGSGENYGMYE